MGYAIKVPNADFSSVALDHINYIEPIPCTDISFLESVLEFEQAEEVKTLTAVTTPSDTTDSIIWSSSNNQVATVANGSVTIHGIGTAAITATCGEHSVSITVTQTQLKAPYSLAVIANKYPSLRSVTGGSIIAVDSINDQYTMGQPIHPGRDLKVQTNDDVECVRVPYGATRIHVATTDGVAVSISFTYVVDTTNLLTYNGLEYPAHLRNQTFVNSQTGYVVEYGEAVIFRPIGDQVNTLDYIYFT